MESDDRRRGLQRRTQDHRNLVVLPRMEIDHVPVGEELGHSRREDSEVGARVLSSLRTGVAGHPDDLPHLQVTILGELAEEAHLPVLEIAEGAIGGAGGPEAVET